MQTIGKFDQYHPEIIGDGQDHFSEIFGLNGSVLVKNFRDFGQAVDDFSDSHPKNILDVLERDMCVFNGVVEQGTDNCRWL